MSRPSNIPLRAINYDHTLVLAIELSNKSWVLAAQVPGLCRKRVPALRSSEVRIPSGSRREPRWFRGACVAIDVDPQSFL